MGAAQADDVDPAVALRAGGAAGLAVDQAVEPETRLGEPVIGHKGNTSRSAARANDMPCLAMFTASLAGSNAMFIDDKCSYENEVEQGNSAARG